MGTKHKHYDVIVAWAAGEEIEIFDIYATNEWRTWERPDAPSFLEGQRYRIKPKRVKKEGWVNIFPSTHPKCMAMVSRIYAEKKTANEVSSINRIACARIEWEEDA